MGLELNHLTRGMGFYFYYRLSAQENGPEIGHEVVVQLLAWIEDDTNETRRKLERVTERLELTEREPPNWMKREDGRKQCLWNGPTYQLKDLDQEDVLGCAELVANALVETYPKLKQAVDVGG